MTEESEIGNKDYPYSVKIEQTALGARISTHAYANTPVDAADQAIEMYAYTRDMLFQRGHKIAPEEPTVKKLIPKE